VTKFKTLISIQIKYWTLWCMDHFSASTCTRVTNCQNWTGTFMAHRGI